MKKIILLTSFLIVLTLGFIQKVSAQYYYYDDNTYDTPLTFEAGVSVGAMNSLTDVGGRSGVGKGGLKDLYLGNGSTHPCGSIYIAAVYKYAYGLRLEATYGRVSASDSSLKNVAASTDGRYQRNLSFRSKISEVSLVAEFYPLFMFIDWSNRDQDPPKFSPYLLAGVGVFSFNPQAKDSTGTWINLQPLHTEGEGFAQYPNRKNYNLTQINFPVGIGLKYQISSTVNIRGELMWRILNTDYLDDVSTTYINPADYDTYFAKNGHDWNEANSLNMRNKNVSPPNSGLNSHPGSIRGDSKHNDTYFSFNIKIGYVFGRESR